MVCRLTSPYLTLTNIDFSLIRSCGSHPTAISQLVPKVLYCVSNLKIVLHNITLIFRGGPSVKWAAWMLTFPLVVVFALYCTANAHYSDVIMSMIVSQITSVSIVCLTVCSCEDQRKQQSSASLDFVRRVDSPHKGPVTRTMFPLDDVIIPWLRLIH